MLRMVRRAHNRKKLRDTVRKFQAQPGVQRVAAYARAMKTETEKRWIAGIIRDGAMDALGDLGINGPWAGDRKRLAPEAMRTLLTGLIPADVLEMVMEGVE